MYPPLKAYLINLPERKDRLDAFRERFRGWNLDLEVVPGIKHEEPWKGCALSHLAIVQKAKAAALPWVLILEDDAAPTDLTPERFNSLLEALWSKRSEWDIFNGGPSNVKREETSFVAKDPPLLKTKGQTSHFILMNSSVFDTFLKDITNTDQRIIDLYYRETFRMFATYPYIAIQAPGYSTIEGKSVDYVPGLKQSEGILKTVLYAATQTGGRRRKTRRRPRRKQRRNRRKTRQRGGQVPAPTFHILIATAGRPTLKRMLDSLKGQLAQNDAITIVFDGKDAKSKSGFTDAWKEGFKCPIATFEEEPPLGHWGHGIRNKYQGILQPKTTYVMHADDDDAYTPDAFERLRSKSVKPECLYVIKFKAPDGRIIPTPGTTKVEQNNIGTPSGVIPFENAKNASWGKTYGGDGAYYIDLSTKVKCVEFLDDVVYTVMK
jgi:GR25 family glycosyltransferase involved in LPS biosynthesis